MSHILKYVFTLSTNLLFSRPYAMITNLLTDLQCMKPKAKCDDNKKPQPDIDQSQVLLIVCPRVHLTSLVRDRSAQKSMIIRHNVVGPRFRIAKAILVAKQK